jgi:endo-1,4-beta-D-glucanase Y
MLPTDKVVYVNSAFTADVGYVQSATATLTDVAAGQTLFAIIACGTNISDFGGISDNRGNSWVKMDDSTTGKALQVWYVASAAAGSTTATVTSSGGGYNDISFSVRQYANVSALSPIVTFSKVLTTDYKNFAEATITPTALTNGLSILAGNGSGANVATAGTNEMNVTNAPNGMYANTHTADKPFTTLTATTGRLGYTEYTQGTIWLIELRFTGGGTPIPDPTYPTFDWHPFGVQPNKTVAQLRAIARAKYDQWFGFTLSSTGMPAGMPAGAKRIRVPDQGFYQNPEFGGTVSEGMGYGLLIKAYFSNPALGTGVYDPNAQADFDNLWKYVKYYKNAHGLMNWNIKNDGTVADTGGATDGDLDIAMALVVMARTHAPNTGVNYTAEATTYINAIRDWEFVPATGTSTGTYPNIMTNGDGWGFDTNNIMPDYFRPGFMREFFLFTGDSRWIDILNMNYDYMLKYYYDNYQGGLVPDRQTREHTSLGADTDMVTYNSVRAGFSVMVDYLWNGPRVPALGLNTMNKMAAKAKANFTTGGNVKAPNYDLNFSTWQTYSNLSGYGLVGPATLGDKAFQTFSTEIIDAMSATSEFGSSYFNGGVGLMALMVMTGIAQPFRATPTFQLHNNLTTLNVG